MTLTVTYVFKSHCLRVYFNLVIFDNLVISANDFLDLTIKRYVSVINEIAKYPKSFYMAFNFRTMRDHVSS